MGDLTGIFLQPAGIGCCQSIVTIEGVSIRIQTRTRIGVGGRRTTTKQVAQEPHCIGDVQLLVIVDVSGIPAGKVSA